MGAAWYPDPAWVGRPAAGRHDLPLICANFQHRAWAIPIESYLKGARATPPVLDYRPCHFGRWLDSEAAASYQGQPVLQAITTLLRQVHELAVAMLAVNAGGDGNREALARHDELYVLWFCERCCAGGQPAGKMSSRLAASSRSRAQASRCV